MLFIITAVAIILAIIMYFADKEAFVYVFGFIGVICLVITAVYLNTIVETRRIDKQISNYEEQSVQIETDIAALVNQYQEYEKQVITDAKPDTDTADVIAFAQTYPELKANVLVQEQIATLKEYNNKILELKDERTEAEIAYFWLFFGKHPF